MKLTAFRGIISRRGIAIISTVILATASSTRAEFVLSAFTAQTIDENSDVHVRQSGGTDATIHDGSFDGEDFKSPVYYGGRFAYFLHEDKPGFGFGVEFFHAKVYLDTDNTRHVSGTRNGVPVNANEPVSDTIQSFNNSHGLNFLTADIFYRWVFDEQHAVLSHIRPYFGAGIGVVIPHVEAEVGGRKESEYQVHGPGVQGIAGVDFKVTHHWSLFTEYKFTYASLDEEIPGGKISFEPMVHHFVGGVSFHF